ncbi:ferredoxin reductase-like protein [Mollisia scopiformis]|uniref:NADH-cytochrome b5 reductase n=1 Tax=Mollisia scopiformis TaxID=149040 RepID=A0A132BC23_MOLSC|nr:ferredoxin reductase-like protein [Mollisia scopiformis]KUJ09955.1 ferredoxin reductase-like protein [Mollisia scopiformis]
MLSTTRYPLRNSAPAKVFGKGPAFTSLRLDSVETLSHDTKRFRFKLPSETTVSGLNLTSAVLTFSRPAGQFFPVVRPYTPISDLSVRGFIDLAVKRYPKGKASNHIHSLSPGDTLFFLGSIRAYSWKPNEFKNITLIAGGAGITPMYQLIRGIFRNPEENTNVTLVFGINNDRDALFKDEFAEMEKKFPGRFKVIYTVSNPDEGSPFPKGYVTKELLSKVMAGSKERSEKVFVCGPPAMEASLTGSRRGPGGILSELGFRKDQVFKF